MYLIALKCNDYITVHFVWDWSSDGTWKSCVQPLKSAHKMINILLHQEYLIDKYVSDVLLNLGVNTMTYAFIF